MAQMLLNGLVLFGVAALVGFGVKFGAWCFDRMTAPRRARPQHFYVGEPGPELVSLGAKADLVKF